jgi:hypothetical protein
VVGAAIAARARCSQLGAEACRRRDRPARP